jgi:hypothetical protein
LGRSGPEAKEAVPVLVELLKDEDLVLREKVRYAIEKIDPVVSQTLPKND